MVLSYVRPAGIMVKYLATSWVVLADRPVMDSDKLSLIDENCWNLHGYKSPFILVFSVYVYDDGVFVP